MSSPEYWESLFPAGKHGIHLFPAYESRAKNVAAEVIRTADGLAAVEIIVKLLQKINARTVVCVPEAGAETIGLVPALQAIGIVVLTKPADIAKYAKNADAGITEMEFAIAETGSCVENDALVEKRLCSTLPPLHIGLLKTANIVATLPDAFQLFAQVFDRGYISFITGPSRTADIERVLTIGMHGPARMIPIFIDAWEVPESCQAQTCNMKLPKS